MLTNKIYYFIFVFRILSFIFFNAVQQKLSLDECQQSHQKKDIYKSQQQFVPSKLFQQSLLLAKSTNFNNGSNFNSVSSEHSSNNFL